ncbi:MAG: hypothetical protein FWH40_08810 [Coriobacteriia bacterium]|nr:hypothetical protein [Coriobacteriia bacterium]
MRLIGEMENRIAHKAANTANGNAHNFSPSLKGLDIHEVQPVRFGGSPTDPENKILVSRAEHVKLTNWWNDLQFSVLNGKQGEQPDE